MNAREHPRPRLDHLMTEKAFQEAVVQVALLNRWWVHHHHDARRSEPGWPDLVLLRAGVAIFAELKREDGKVTAEQGHVLELLEAAGCEAVVWRPSMLDQIIARLSERP